MKYNHVIFLGGFRRTSDLTEAVKHSELFPDRRCVLWLQMRRAGIPWDLLQSLTLHRMDHEEHELSETL